MSNQRWSAKQNARIEAPDIDAFIAEVIEVSRKHGMSIAHEDGHGGFLIEAFDQENADWLSAAADAR